MTKNSGWRDPTEDEKKLALYWIKRNRSGNVSFPAVCFWVVFLATVAYIVASYIFKPEYLDKCLQIMPIMILPLGFIGLFCIYNTMTENEKVWLVTKGDFQIIDAKVQFVGKKRLGRYSYVNVVEVVYRSGFGPQPTTFTVSRQVKNKTNIGDEGYVIRFPHGNNWTKKSLVFISCNK